MNTRLYVITIFSLLAMLVMPTALAADAAMDFEIIPNTQELVVGDHSSVNDSDDRPFSGAIWVSPQGDVVGDHLQTANSVEGTPLDPNGDLPEGVNGHFAAIWNFEVTSSGGDDWDVVLEGGNFTFNMSWYDGALMWATDDAEEPSPDSPMKDIFFSHIGTFNDSFGEWVNNNNQEVTPGAQLDNLWTFFTIDDIESPSSATGTFAVVGVDEEEDVMGFHALTNNSDEIEGLDPESNNQWATFIAVNGTGTLKAHKMPYNEYEFAVEKPSELVEQELFTTAPTSPDNFTNTPVNLSIDLVAEDEFWNNYGNVRVVPMGEDNDTIQFWAEDTSGNWYDINQVGWDPEQGFPIDTDAVTEVYVVGDAESYDVTLELVEVETEKTVISQEETFEILTPANLTVAVWAVPSVAVIGQDITSSVTFENTGGATFTGEVGYFFNNTESGMPDEELIISGGETESVERTYPVTEPAGFFNHSIRYLNESENGTILEQRQVAVYEENTTYFNVCEYGIDVQTYLNEVPTGSTVYLCASETPYDGFELTQQVNVVGEARDAVFVKGRIRADDVNNFFVENLTVQGEDDVVRRSSEISSLVLDATPGLIDFRSVDDVTLRNVTIETFIEVIPPHVESEYAPSSTSDYRGLFVGDSTNIVVEDVSISDSGLSGAYFLDVTNATLTGLNTNNSGRALDQNPGLIGGYGIGFAGDSNNIVLQDSTQEEVVGVFTVGDEFSNLTVQGYEYRALMPSMDVFSEGLSSTSIAAPDDVFFELSWYFETLSQGRDFARHIEELFMGGLIAETGEAPETFSLVFIEELTTGKYYATSEHFGTLIAMFLEDETVCEEYAYDVSGTLEVPCQDLHHLKDDVLFGDEELDVFLPQGWRVDEFTPVGGSFAGPSELHASNGNLLQQVIFTVANSSVGSATGLPTNRGEVATVRFGSLAGSLEFNQNVSLDVWVGTNQNNQELIVYRSSELDGSWTQEGISTNTCVVDSGWCSFTATQASYFAVTRDTTPQMTGSGGSGSNICVEGYERVDGRCVPVQEDEPEPEPEPQPSPEDTQTTGTGTGTSTTQEVEDEETIPETTVQEEGTQDDSNLLTGAVVGGGFSNWGWLAALGGVLLLLGGGYLFMRRS